MTPSTTNKYFLFQIQINRDPDKNIEFLQQTNSCILGKMEIECWSAAGLLVSIVTVIRWAWLQMSLNNVVVCAEEMKYSINEEIRASKGQSCSLLQVLFWMNGKQHEIKIHFLSVIDRIVDNSSVHMFHFYNVLIS